MKRIILFTLTCFTGFSVLAQVMTPELLWSLKRISPVGLTKDKQSVIYKTIVYDQEENISTTAAYLTDIESGKTEPIDTYDELYIDPKISPSGKHRLLSRKVKIHPVTGVDFYPDLAKSNVLIYEDLNYRHWDAWEDGAYHHVFIETMEENTSAIDIMKGEPYDTPLQPFGGPEDYIWNHDGSAVIYACKKQFGRDYALSTNSDLYRYDLETGLTSNLTVENRGYDTHPACAPDGTLAWLQMDEPGYESDKNDIIILRDQSRKNLTKNLDGTVNSFIWSEDYTKIYFTAPTEGTVQLFETDLPFEGEPTIRQITDGVFDINSIIGQSGNRLLVTRTDMNHAAEIFVVDVEMGSMRQLTAVNDSIYAQITLSKIEKRKIATTDDKEMVTWVIYPPDFDATKKYPALLYCQGGPQAALSQFYSFRWNFQLMAAQGYIVVAPNRRGMPGHGEKWNRQISGDWGGQNMQDYLSAIDALSQESYVDEDRLGCVGASYGGYSAFFLAGIHNNRFKTFIAHDGVFNTRSMYGTTEELFFVNKDLGGPYWQNPVPKAYKEFNPINQVNQWDTPILIIQGGKDYRVPIGQGLEAFQAAQIRGIKSKLLFFPEENHWVLTPQNGLIWQKEFFKWLSDTLL